jgi:hypothetical protein
MRKEGAYMQSGYILLCVKAAIGLFKANEGMSDYALTPANLGVKMMRNWAVRMCQEAGF